MVVFDLAAIANICNGQLAAADSTHAGKTMIRHAVFDSREVGSDDLFVALPGEQTDGHAYVQHAQQSGAAGAVVAQPQACALPQIVVSDSRAAFTQIATARRAQFANTVIAITGSNGKTTVKEMTASICRAAYGDAKVHCNHANYNNDLGVAHTLMQLLQTHRVLIAEVGMDHAGELTALKETLQPHIMLVNNAQRAHIGHFGSTEAIARAKGELLAGEGGVAIINADDPHADLWREVASRHEIITFGLNDEAHVCAHPSKKGVVINGVEIPLQVAGEHNVANAAAAAAVARVMGIGMDAVAAGLAGFAGVAGRTQLVALDNGSLLINDTYNANPDSTAAALAVLKQVTKQHGCRPILVLGDMLALGESAHAEHEKIVKHCLQHEIAVRTYGSILKGVMASLAQSDNHYATHAALAQAVNAELAQQTCCVLVKGSRGSAMEGVIAELQTGTGAAA